MGLRNNRKGIVAMFDAMIFIVLLTTAATWLFVYTSMEEPDEPMAKRVSDDIFSVEVRTCDLLYLEDTKILPMDTLLAASMNSDRTGKTELYLSELLDQLIPAVYGYELTLEYSGHSMYLYRQSDRPMSSEYTAERQIDGAGTLTAMLRIY